MLNSRSIMDLVPEAQGKAHAAQEAFLRAGLDVVISSTLRDLESQAVLFRTNRPWSDPKFAKGDIQTKVAKFRARGFPELADVIMRVGPQAGDGGGLKTQAAPGESWHNYARAFDGFPLIHGKLAGDNDPAWQKYGAAVESVGLRWAGRWVSFKEMAHAQMDEGSNPLKVLGPVEVRKALAAWL